MNTRTPRTKQSRATSVSARLEGRKGQLRTTEQKLLFSLVYQKTYPVQVVVGEIFGMSQSRANRWIHELLPILQQALDEGGADPFQG